MERKKEDLLYHGTSLSGIEGELIDLSKENKGVGWNIFTLGRGFYMTGHLAAAQLFSHIAEEKRLLRQPNIDPLERISQTCKAGIGRLYAIELKEARILDAGTDVAREAAIQLLSDAEISPATINRFTRPETVALEDIANLLRYSKALSGNVWEYITKSLAYDGLRIREESWNNWDYYPSELGLDYEQFKEHPVTVILYDTGKIKSFKELYPHSGLSIKPNRPDHGLKPKIPGKKRGQRM